MAGFEKRDLRLKIGFLAKDLFNGYEVPIWKGVAQAAQHYDVNLFSYSHENANFHLIDTELFDGMIAITATIDWGARNNDIEWFKKFYAAVPTVSIGRVMPGAFNLLVDNETGFRQIIEHIVVVHKRKEIAFIRGPVNSFEAEARFKIYREVLAKYGLPFKEELIVNGNFSTEDGIKAAQTLIQRKVRPDALVGANDYMAIFAMDEFRRMGYKIPEDLSVVGFDDVRNAEEVSLSTVRQPFTELGYKAVEAVLAMIERNVPETQYLPAFPVYRCSCGCNGQSSSGRSSSIRILSQNDSKSESYPDDLLERAAQEFNERFVEIKEKIGNQWAYNLLNALRVLDAEADSPFLNELKEMIRKGDDCGINASIWYSVVREIKTVMAQYHSKAKSKKILDEVLWDAFELIGTTAMQIRNEKKSENERELGVITRLYAMIISTFDIGNLMTNIEGILPELRIQSYFLSHYSEDNKEQATLKSYFNLSHNAIINEQLSFPSKKLVPGRFSEEGKRYSFIIFPVIRFGFVVFEMKYFEDLDFGTHFGDVCIIVRIAALINTIFYFMSTLEEKIEERTQQLKEAQENLVATARQAGMAEVAIGVVHNVGNILNSIGISAESISETMSNSKLSNLQKANELMHMHRSDLADFFANDSKAGMLPDYYQRVADILMNEQNLIKKETKQLLENISLIGQVIKTLQDYARSDLNISLQELTDIATIIETALKIQESQLVKNQVQVIKDFTKVKPCMVQKAKLTNILVNLINNAVEAMQRTPIKDRILLVRLLTKEPHSVMIKIVDHGEGISAEQLKKVFMFGFTTKKDGHGFGLHTCSNYMKEMGGTLTAQSEGVGKGATFTLVLPLE